MTINIPPGFVGADLLVWEATYDDGTKVGETQGVKYGALDRSRIKKFSITTMTGEEIFGVYPPPGFTGANLIFRRRTTMAASTPNGRSVLFLIGFGPNGPVYVIDPDAGQWSVSEEGFVEGHPFLSPPQAMPGEPQSLIDDITKRP